MDRQRSTELGLDHVVILVNDLEAASADYAGLGFTVIPGGEHADGTTHNALIAFADGAYLELIAFRRPAPDGHIFRPAEEGWEGIVAFALLPSNIRDVIEAARDRGLEIEGPREGGRVRPDGQRVSWEIGRPDAHDLPFLCADVTPRDLRVPGGAARQHPNGVVGITGVCVAVSHLAASVERYRALLGAEPLPSSEMPGTSD